MRKTHNPETPAAVSACHDLLKWMIPHLDKFPRNRRFTLGERIETGLLEVLEFLVEAAYHTASRKKVLGLANLRLHRVRHLWRLCYELMVIPLQRYRHGSGLIDDIGRQIGGWARSAR